MSEAPAPATKPSKVAITKMLAEAEVARRRALRPWLLATLLPLLLGGTLLAFTSYAVYKRIQRLNALNLEIEEKEKSLANLKAAVNDAFAGLNDADTKSPEEVKQAVVNAITSDPAVAAANPRVFIHIYSERQLPRARQVSQALKTAGYILPGTDIEQVGDAVSTNQVRYFRPEDKEAAEKVVGILAGQGVAEVRVMPVTTLTAPPGTIEVWFAPSPGEESPQPQEPDNRRPRVDAARDRLQDAIRNNNRPAQNANRPAVRPRPGWPARPQK